MKNTIKKRFRVTKNGKLIRRPMAQDHFRTRNSQKSIRNKRKSTSIDFPNKTILNSNA